MKAVVLAGGQGTRLAPYTATLPKPLLPIGDIPILELLLRQLKASGVTEVILAVNHLHHLLQAFFGDGTRIGVRIAYSHEETPLGTAGPVASVLPVLDDNFIVTNGDLLTTIDFSALLADHSRTNADATIATYRRTIKSEFGIIEIDDNMKMKDYHEKPEQTHLVSMGLYVLKRSAVEPFLTPGAKLDMPDLLKLMTKSGMNVRCFAPDCFWLDIGRPEDYAQAQQLFSSNRDKFIRRNLS